MPRFARSAATANEGVSAFAKLIAAHGSIFRETPQQTDIGIDGFLEPIYDEHSLGCLLAVQIKSGSSYVSRDGRKFVIPVSKDHLEYWSTLPMPVILIGYDPSRDLLAGISIHDYLKAESYHERAVSSISFAVEDGLKPEFVDSLKPLCQAYLDQFVFTNFLDLCYSSNASDRRTGVATITRHPRLRDSKVVLSICRALLRDTDEPVRNDAMHHLAFCTGRVRWSWNPNSNSDRDLSRFASSLCSDVSGEEAEILVSNLRDSPLWGPSSEIERLADVVLCSDAAIRRLESIAENPDKNITDRQSAYWIVRGASLDSMCEAIEFGDELAKTLWAEALSDFIELGGLKV